MTPAGPTSAGPCVLYVGGTSRSGSTLLECLTARLEGVVVLGEVTHLWRRGLLEDQLCACEQPFSRCPFWQQVGHTAFGGWERVNVEHVLRLADQVDRQRRLPATGRRRPPRSVAAPAREYAAYYRSIYEAAATVSGADVVVDSSKVPPTGMAVSHDPELDLRVLHIVRDSRGVAYSWTKTVTRPETATGEPMPRFGVRSSALQWTAHNLEMELFRRRRVPMVRIRYEDLVNDAATVLGGAWRALDLPGDGRLPMIGLRSIELRPTHSVAGNPMRFRLGVTDLRPDLEWRRAMPASQRRVVTAITLPLLRAYGYRDR